MSPAPKDFLAHLRAENYHPRSNKHSNALAEGIVTDLIAHCPAIQNRAREGHLVYDLNFTLRSQTAEWNVDLVLGQPSMGFSQKPLAGEIVRSKPSTVEIAVEIKAVMTEHRKAIKNRKRDFEAHHDHVHRYRDNAIAGGLLIINASPTFTSPLRRGEPSIHRAPDLLVQHCVDEMRAVASRSKQAGIGLDAKGVIVVSMDTSRPENAVYVSRPPVPQIGDPLHYDAFIQAICNRFTSP